MIKTPGKKELRQLSLLRNMMADSLDIQYPDLTSETLPFFVWSNRIRGLRSLLCKEELPHSSIEHIKNNVKILQNSFEALYNKRYVSKKILKLPPDWVYREFCDIKKNRI